MTTPRPPRTAAVTVPGVVTGTVTPAQRRSRTRAFRPAFAPIESAGEFPFRIFDTPLGEATARIRFDTLNAARALRPVLNVELNPTRLPGAHTGHVWHDLDGHGTLLPGMCLDELNAGGDAPAEAVTAWDAWVATGEYRQGLTAQLFRDAVRAELARRAGEAAEAVTRAQERLAADRDTQRALTVLEAGWAVEDPDRRATAVRLAPGWAGTADELLAAVAAIHD